MAGSPHAWRLRAPATDQPWRATSTAAATRSSGALGSVLSAIGDAEIAAHEKRQLRRFAVQLALEGNRGSAVPERAEFIEGKAFEDKGRSLNYQVDKVLKYGEAGGAVLFDIFSAAGDVVTSEDDSTVDGAESPNDVVDFAEKCVRPELVTRLAALTKVCEDARLTASSAVRALETANEHSHKLEQLVATLTEALGEARVKAVLADGECERLRAANAELEAHVAALLQESVADGLAYVELQRFLEAQAVEPVVLDSETASGGLLALRLAGPVPDIESLNAVVQQGEAAGQTAQQATPVDSSEVEAAPTAGGLCHDSGLPSCGLWCPGCKVCCDAWEHRQACARCAEQGLREPKRPAKQYAKRGGRRAELG